MMNFECRVPRPRGVFAPSGATIALAGWLAALVLLGAGAARAQEPTPAADDRDDRMTGSEPITTEAATNSATSPASSALASDDALLRAALAWRTARADSALPGGWAHAVDVVEPVGLEVGARVLAGVVGGDPWGLQLLDPTAGSSWSWGARAHVGYSFGAWALRVEGGFVRHEVVAPQSLEDSALAVHEFPLGLHVRWSLPHPVAAFLLEAGGGVSLWSVPVRVNEVSGLERVERAWTGRAEFSLGTRLFANLEVLATCAVLLSDDLGGTGQVLSEVSMFFGGSVGFVFGAYE